MNSRIWWWGAGATVLGAVLLASSINSRAGWRAPSSDTEQVLTLNQLVGIVVGGLLLVIGLWTLLIATRRLLRTRARAHRFAAGSLRQEPLRPQPLRQEPPRQDPPRQDLPRQEP